MNDVPPSRPPGRPEDSPPRDSNGPESINSNPALGVDVGSTISGAADAAKDLLPGTIPVLVEGFGALAVSKGTAKGHLRIEAPGRPFLEEKPYGFWTKLGTAKSFAKSFPGAEEDRVAAVARAVQVAFEAAKDELKALAYGSNRGRPDERKEPSAPITQDARERGLSRLRDPAVFYKLGLLMELGWKVPHITDQRFVVGEPENRRLVPLLLAGVDLGLVQIVQIKGPPATAKDSMVSLAVGVLPFTVKRMGYFTAASMRYGEPVTLLYLQDAAAPRGEAARHLRLLRADDGGLEWQYTVKDPQTGEMGTITGRVDIKGVVTTTNELQLDPALASGAWILGVDDSPALGHEVKLQRLRYHAGSRGAVPPEELEAWRAAFKLVLENPPTINIPWAEKLLPLLSGNRTTTRRSADKLCNLIRLVAAFRRFQKDKSEEADLVDLYIALRIGRGAILGSLGDLEPRERAVLEKVKLAGEAVVRDICNSTKWGYTTVYELLESLVKKDYLTKHKEGRANKYAPIWLDSETEGGDLSVTFTERSEGLEWAIQAIRNLGFDLSNFQWGGEEIVDPLTGEPVSLIYDKGDVSTPPSNDNNSPISERQRKLERSELKEDRPQIVVMEAPDLSVKGGASSNLVKSLTEHEKAIIDFVRQNAKQGIGVTDVVAAMTTAGLDHTSTGTVVDRLLDANLLKKDEQEFLHVVEGAAR